MITVAFKTNKGEVKTLTIHEDNLSSFKASCLKFQLTFLWSTKGGN